MRGSRFLLYSLFVALAALPAGCAPGSGAFGSQGVAGDPITGEGLPNPNPTVLANWGEQPAGREWGTSAGIQVDPIDGHIWAYERCASGSAGGPGVNCDSNAVDPVLKFNRNTGEIMTMLGAGVMVTPHGLHVDSEGNVWVTDFAGNADGTKGHQVHKFSPAGELLLSLGVAGQPGNAPGQFNQPNAVAIAPNGNIFVADGHSGQGMTTAAAVAEGRAAGQTGRIQKFTPEGTFIHQWGEIGVLHGEFRTPHALAFDSRGRLWVVDRGNHRLEIFDQDGNYLESRYAYGRISGIFITADDMVYAIDSESGPYNHVNWSNGVRIGHLDRDEIVGFIPPFPADTRPYQGAAGEGIAVDWEGNVYAAEGPNSLRFAGGPFTKYVIANP